MMKRIVFAAALLMSSLSSLSAAYSPGPLPPQTQTQQDVGATEGFEARGYRPHDVDDNSRARNGRSAHWRQGHHHRQYRRPDRHRCHDPRPSSGSQTGFIRARSLSSASTGVPTIVQNITTDGKYNFIVGGDASFRLNETVAGTSGTTFTYSFDASPSPGRMIVLVVPQYPGVGSITAVPAASTNGTALGTLPALGRGARIYLHPGDSISYTVQSTAPTAAPAAAITLTASQPSSATRLHQHRREPGRRRDGLRDVDHGFALVPVVLSDGRPAHSAEFRFGLCLGRHA